WGRAAGGRQARGGCPPADGPPRPLADEYECQACPPLMWSDSNDTTCFERRPVFLEWREVPTVILTLLAALGTLGTLGTLLLFWRNFGTPVVRSAGGPLCFLMLGALLAAYAAVPLYVGPPTVARCLWRQALFAACSTVCISCVAVRSFQIACIFRMARRLPRAYTSWLRCRGPYLSVAAVTALKLAFVAGAELTHAATLTTLDGLGDPRVVVLSCSPDYRKGLLLNTGLDLLLAVLGFGFAYAGKELPTSYNEAKFITFCLAFYFSSSVCLCTVMSVYEGVLVTTLDLLVAVLNLLCISLGYFGPKCSVILFYPERNTQAYFHSMIQGYTLGTGTG
ncbi:taste receptor type 1 member 2-like, partial [Erinaceus europaeus]|uniref:Taste receptor type 1 member 2 n=1 Tax=Erinaceus europaeus TaxID=9365 RepID=A0ABM3YBD8_ERIEU